MCSKRIILDKNDLIYKYLKEHKTQETIAKEFGVCIDTVRRCMDEYGIKAIGNKGRNLHSPIVFSEEQYNYLQGAMLGDGSLLCNKKGGNAYFSYTSKSKQHCQFVSEPFDEYLIENGSRKYEYLDLRTEKTYYRYIFKTQMNLSFTEERNRWYINGKKHIPNDLILNKTICLLWYIGDGCICKSRKASETIKLATNCFEREEQEDILVPQLKQFKARTNICARNINGEPQYGIFIPHAQEEAFIEYIGECPFSDYMYKWNVRPYNNFSINKNPEIIEKTIQLFKLGNSAGTISKIVGIDRATVVKYLSLNGLDYKLNINKKQKVVI